MPCCSSSPLTEPSARGSAGRFAPAWLIVCLLLVLAWLMVGPAHAQRTEATPVSLQRTDEGLWLSARLPMQLPDGIEDALNKGVPLHFVWQAEVFERRWYWYDKRVAAATRLVRLAYQPLTRRWRLSVGSGLSGLANALHQNVDSLSEALAVVTRVSQWKVAEPGAFDADEKYRLEFSFRLDVTMLPRPLQLTVLGPGEASVDYRQVFDVPPVMELSAQP